MNAETTQFLNECLDAAAESIRLRQERMETDPIFRAQEQQKLYKQQMAIHASSAEALERLERNGGVRVYQ